MEQQKVQFNRKMIEVFGVIDLDSTLVPFRSIQQKWITSLQFMLEPETKPHTKNLEIVNGLYLVIGFAEKNRPPIYQIDFLSNPNNQWINVRVPQNFTHLISSYFCYKTQQTEYSGPLIDIDTLNIQKKRSLFEEDKQIVTVPHGYHMLNNPINATFLIYKKIRSKIEQTYKPALIEKYPINSMRKINTSLIPILCFPEGIRLSREIKGFITLNFIITLETAQRLYCTCLVFKQSLSEHYQNKLNIKHLQKLYNQKAIFIISKYCFTDQFSQCLQHLYRLSMSKNDVPFYRVVHNFVDKLQLPEQKNGYGVTYAYGGSHILFDINTKFPTTSQKAMYCLFKFLDIDIITNVFQALLLQKKIVFVSQSKTVLGYASQAFTNLLFPFRWQQVIIPILPLTLKQYLTAPVPLIAGISPILFDSSIETQSIIVFLDTNQIVNDETLPPLPQKLQKQLRKRLSYFEMYVQQEVKQYLDNPENTYIFKMQQVQNPHFHAFIIRDIFFQFMLTFMRNYKKYWKHINNSELKQTSSMGFSTQPQLMNDMFKVQDFLSDLGMTKIGSFGYKFVQTSIFTAFMERKYQFPDDSQIAFFDQCIQTKKNNKQEILITAIKNTKYSVTQHPPIEGNGKNVYVYERFPSIHDPDYIKSEDIEIIVPDENQQLNTLEQLVHEQYSMNCYLFQPSFHKHQDPVYDKIMNLLLKANRQQFPTDLSNRLKVLYCFIELYTKQIQQINQIFASWPKWSNQITFISIKKRDYFRKTLQKKFNKNQIIGVYENDDYQMLIYEDKKIRFTTLKKSSNKQGHYLQIKSNKIKNLLNTLIPNQSLWLIRFVEQTKSYQWTIQTLINFKQWIYHNKEK